jgi:hypothetical protein
MSTAKRTDSDCFDRLGRYPVESARGAKSEPGHEAADNEWSQLSPYAGL